MKIEMSREQLRPEYEDVLRKNPLLARIEAHAANVSWTVEEIRTFQLIVAVASNASMQKRIAELEAALSAMTEASKTA